MRRREFLGRAAAGLAALALPGPACSGERPPAPAGAPNVLFIVLDDLNDWIGCLGGHPQARTPHIDALAARGVLFANAHAASPVCNGSRVAVLTGVRPSTSGVYNNEEHFRSVLPDVVTLPQYFREHGYHVAGGGKIFHGELPDPDSWDETFPAWQKVVPRFAQFLSGNLQQPADPEPRRRPLNGITAAFDWGPLDVDDAAMGDGKVAAWAVDELRAPRDRPFFVGVGITRPHLPWFAPRKYFESPAGEAVRLPAVREDDLDDLPPLARQLALRLGDHVRILARGKWGEAVAAYLACVRFADAVVGQVLDALQASPHAQNTVVALWGDNGFHLGEKQAWRKGTLWEESTRCPLVIVAPGVAREGSVCSRAVSLMDVHPTLVELCGLPLRADTEARSLAPLLRDPSARREEPALTTASPGNHSVRSERWRYSRYADGGEELYDHAQDEHEWTNLAGDSRYAAVAAELGRWIPARSAPAAPPYLRARIRNLLRGSGRGGDGVDGPT